MKRLYAFLFFLVFITMIAMGWAIDALYPTITAQDKHVLPHSEKIILSYRDFLDSASQSPLATPLPDVFKLESSALFVLPEPLNEQLTNGQVVVLNSEEGVTLHVLLKSQNLVLSLGPLSEQDNAAPWLKYTLTALFYCGIALVLLFWFKPLLMAVLQLSRALQSIAQGHLETRVDSTSLYLKVLFDDFNLMAQKLDMLNENNQLFSQAVSHDIRTPLARILFACEKLQNHSDKAISEVALSISQDVNKIETLSKELLTYSRLEKQHELKPDLIDVTLLMEQVMAGFDFKQKKLNFEALDIPKELKVDANLLQKIVNNLLSNALHYCHTQVNVVICLKQQHLHICVEDDGDGLNLKDKNVADYYQPFVQLERHEKHFGLGLAIVHRAVKLFKGSLQVDNNSSLGGARFCVTIPLAVI